MMKPCQSILSGILLFLVLATPGITHAQNGAKMPSGKGAKIQDLVNSGNYVFKARSALSMGGRTRQLTSNYSLRVSKDTIEAYLPYFGRAYTAPIDPTKGGIEFTSTKFNYVLSERKKGGWDVTIKPTDAGDIQQLILTISTGGYASLQVTSNRRQPISFNGVVEEK